MDADTPSAADAGVDKEEERHAEAVMDQFLRVAGLAVDAGLDAEMVVAGLFRGGEDAIARLALDCLALLSPHGKSEWRGSVLITYLIHGMLTNCCMRNIPPPAALVVAYDEQFRVEGIGRPGKGEKLGSFERALHYHQKHPGASVSEIARAAGCDRRTISRWKDARAFDSWIFPARKRIKPRPAD